MNKLRIFKYIFIAIVLGLIVVSVIVITKNIKIEETQESIETINEAEEDDYFHGDDIYNDYEEFNDRYILNVYGLSGITDEEKQELKYNIDNIYECILKMMQPNQNWNTFPISKEVREELNNEVKEVSKYNFDKVEYSDKTLSDIEEYGSVGHIQIIGTKGEKKVMFTFEFSQLNYAIVEFTFLKEQVIQDEEGNEIDTRLICNEENWDQIIKYIVEMDDDMQNPIAVTESFNNKYHTFENAFITQIPSYQDYTRPVCSIETEEQSNFSDLKIIYRSYRRIQGKKRYGTGDVMRLYQVKLILDDNDYIDDVEITPLD